MQRRPYDPNVRRELLATLTHAFGTELARRNVDDPDAVLAISAARRLIGTLEHCRVLSSKLPEPLQVGELL